VFVFLYFLLLIRSRYANINPEDRPEEIRKLVRSIGPSLEADMRNLEKAFGAPVVAVKVSVVAKERLEGRDVTEWNVRWKYQVKDRKEC
jgi:hypothetical protein